MVSVRRHLRTVLTDLRILGLTGLLFGWPVTGIVADVDVLLELATPLVFAYQLLLLAVIGGFPGFHAFWVGFVLFCFTASTLLFSAVDWVRFRRTTSKEPTHESITND